MPTLAATEGGWNLPAWAGPLISIAALVAGCGILLMSRNGVRRTTLVSPWWWSLAAVIVWSALELAASLAAPTTAWIVPLRLTAVSLSFCPIVALLGAKRPQHLAWNFVVLGFWFMMALPAAENYFLHPGQALAVGDARGWFLWLAILLGPINFLPTRYWHASLLIAAGQTVALAAVLPLLRRTAIPHDELIGLSLAALGLIAAWFVPRRSTRGYDRLWLDFRDSFGLLWSLRVQERVNALARSNNWPLTLGWHGFRSLNQDEATNPITTQIEPILRTSFRGLLRRFVSNEWIAERLRDRVH